MSKQSALKGSRLYCSIQTYKGEVFFSLVDYRNSRFTSENPDKIIEFYDSFKNRDDLIEWMKERPMGIANIYEVDGNKEIIVVIPTADFNGKYAKECRENIFKGLHIIFVESGGKGDFYFNYAHNCNVGIRKAMEYTPKWVVVSNDDMVMIDDKDVLLNKLSAIDQEKTMIVFTEPTIYHSYPISVGKRRPIITDFALLFYGLKHKLERDFKLENKIKRRFKVKWIKGPGNKVLSKVLLKNSRIFLLTSSFAIFSSYLLLRERNELFDETYINGWEDFDLSMGLSIKNLRHQIIDYRIDDQIGSTLSRTREESWNRLLRNVVNQVYLDYKISEGLHTW